MRPHREPVSRLLLLGSLTYFANAQDPVALCKNSGGFKCVTQFTFVLCNGDRSVAQPVAPGTQCVNDQIDYYRGGASSPYSNSTESVMPIITPDPYAGIPAVATTTVDTPSLPTDQGSQPVVPSSTDINMTSSTFSSDGPISTESSGFANPPYPMLNSSDTNSIYGTGQPYYGSGTMTTLMSTSTSASAPASTDESSDFPSSDDSAGLPSTTLVPSSGSSDGLDADTSTSTSTTMLATTTPGDGVTVPTGFVTSIMAQADSSVPSASDTIRVVPVSNTDLPILAAGAAAVPRKRSSNRQRW